MNINDFFENTEQNIDIEKDEIYYINLLKKYDDWYYVEGNEPLINDIEYDKLKEYIYEKYPLNPYFLNVGSDIISGEKVKHSYILGSLSKFKIDTIDKWLCKYSKEKIVITPKFDGLSVYVDLIDGKVNSAATRGNGELGTNITNKVKIILKNKSINSINMKIRGEILLPGDIYLKLQKKNRRNAASGIIGKDDLSELQYLDIVFYEIIDSENNAPTEQERLKLLNNNINNNLKYKIEDAKNINTEYLIKILNDFKEEYKDYCDLDGLVLTIDNSIRENIKYPTNKISFKHGDETAIGEVGNIIWETSRTGRVVPVVELIEPIDLSGANISRLSAYNAKYILDNEIIPNTKLKICRSGCVIPKILEIIKN